MKRRFQCGAANTLIDPERPGNVVQVGSAFFQRRVGTVPGRSLEDLVNSQPGWPFGGNAVLHPPGSENQTQFVVDGIPLTDGRSPSFGPEIGAEDNDRISLTVRRSCRDTRYRTSDSAGGGAKADGGQHRDDGDCVV